MKRLQYHRYAYLSLSIVWKFICVEEFAEGELLQEVFAAQFVAELYLNTKLFTLWKYVRKCKLFRSWRHSEVDSTLPPSPKQLRRRGAFHSEHGRWFQL